MDAPVILRDQHLAGAGYAKPAQDFRVAGLAKSSPRAGMRRPAAHRSGPARRPGHPARSHRLQPSAPMPGPSAGRVLPRRPPDEIRYRRGRAERDLREGANHGEGQRRVEWAGGNPGAAGRAGPCAGIGVAGQRPAADIGAEEMGRGGGRREVIGGAGGGGPPGATARARTVAGDRASPSAARLITLPPGARRQVPRLVAGIRYGRSSVCIFPFHEDQAGGRERRSARCGTCAAVPARMPALTVRCLWLCRGLRLCGIAR